MLRKVCLQTCFVCLMCLVVVFIFHRSHFGSRYKLGCCCEAGLFGKVSGSNHGASCRGLDDTVMFCSGEFVFSVMLVRSGILRLQ